MRSYTQTISFNLGIDEMQKYVNIYCPFRPNKIILKNICFDNPSTTGDDIWLFSVSSLLSGFNSRIVTSLTASVQFTNHDLTFHNEREVTGSHLFQFEGVTGDNTHNEQANIVMTFIFEG